MWKCCCWKENVFNKPLHLIKVRDNILCAAAAPEPSDVRWDNLETSGWARFKGYAKAVFVLSLLSGPFLLFRVVVEVWEMPAFAACFVVFINGFVANLVETQVKSQRFVRH